MATSSAPQWRSRLRRAVGCAAKASGSGVSGRVATEHLKERLGPVVAIDYLLIRTLIPDVLHAAGGVEYHAERVIEALDQAQRDYERRVEDDPDDAVWKAEIETHVAVPRSLAWDYPDLLTWLRAVEDRIERQPNLRGGGRARLGLLPAIGDDQLRDEVVTHFGAFMSRVGDQRLLANYALHAAKVPDPNTPMGLLVEGNRVVVTIPDPPAEPVHVWDQFTYVEGRDLRSFTVEALAATEALMDGLLTAFEQAADRARAARPT